MEQTTRRTSDISVVGHRVVHGGERFSEAVMVDEQVLQDIETLIHVTWMADRHQLDRTAEFLNEVLKKRDAEFPAGNPERAWTRVRLARVLRQQGRELDRAKQLLAEAIEILKPNPMVPHDRIEELRAMRADSETHTEGP